ncbi:MAG: GNAT family N-acetyltransferase [Alphaproteobacteria bacterium]|nr:GNAT family N-acetyltransferase [Alphaproteobacteria bacterium]
MEIELNFIQPHEYQDQNLISDLAYIHAACFERPWDENVFNSILKNQSNIMGIIAIDKIKHQRIAFVLAQIVLEQMDIISIAVSIPYRQKSLAKQMMQKIMAKALSQHVQYCYLEVAINNYPAQKLYKSLGFVQIGLRPNYYKDVSQTMIDALVFKYTLDEIKKMN